MTPIQIVLVALAMSMDAFVASIAKGACLQKPRITEALRMGLIFGAIEAVTPLVGWGIGQAAVLFVEAWDHWIAFALLLGLGAHMIHNGLGEPEAPDCRPERHSFWKLALTAVATSIDALAVGVGLAMVEVNIWIAAAAIGCATLIMVTIGVMLGRTIGTVVGQKAEVAGGVVLILVGASILYTHLSAAGA